MLHRGTMKMLSDLISPKALERILSDAARERQTTLSTLDASTLQEILKQDVYRRLQLSVPAALAKRRVQEALDSLSQDQARQTIAGHSTQILTLEDQAKQFALYFDWPETQRLRALLSVARQTTAEGQDAEVLLQEGAELVDSLERKLSEGLVNQGQDLSELKASMSRLSGVGGPKVKRLDTLIRQISEAQESHTLLPAEVERALALALTLRKQVESSVVQQLGHDQKREMTLSLGLQGQDELVPFDLSLLPPEAQARVQTLEREHEARLLGELARDHAVALRLNPALDTDIQALRERSGAGEVLGEAALSDLRGRLSTARSVATGQQRQQLAELAGRLSRLGDHGDSDHGNGGSDAVQVARQGLSVAEGTLQAGGLATDEIAQLAELVGTLENSDSLARERLMALQRDSFELERRAREVPGALNDLAPLIEAARGALAAGELADLEPLWGILERRMGEAAQQRESMDSRAARVMQDYDRYRHLAGETIQRLGRLADVLRAQQRLGVLSNDARGRYLQTLESAEALLTEAQAEFQAAREVTATFGADALSDLLGVFDSDDFDHHDSAADLLSTVSFAPPASPPAVIVARPPDPAAARQEPVEQGTQDDPFGLNGLLGTLSAPATSHTAFGTPPAFPATAFSTAEHGLSGLEFAELEFAGPRRPEPGDRSPSLPRTWLVERGQVTQGDLTPAGDWRTQTDCEADVLRLAWLAAQAAELRPTRLSLEMAGCCWLVLPQPADSTLVVCAPDQQSANEAAGRWRAKVF
ncbi:hypothetical protein [Deinococcus sp.]|uniref:hypothetical protein n=1 Tax=Deinococcus sp. TaxID=47478 RepID=UPI003C7C247E